MKGDCREDEQPKRIMEGGCVRKIDLPPVSHDPWPREEKPDAINPPHYAKLDPEPITVVEGWDLGFCLGNVLKYISRAGRKDASKHVEDLKKARWYLDREIARLETTAKQDARPRASSRL